MTDPYPIQIIAGRAWRGRSCQRTRGRTHGPRHPFDEPRPDLGKILKPFVVFSISSTMRARPSTGPSTPHSGIATLTLARRRRG